MPRPQAMERVREDDIPRDPAASPDPARRAESTPPRAMVAPPSRLSGQPERYREWLDLTDRDRRLLTDDVLRRWTDGLLDDDYLLTDVVRLERRRQVSLRTMREGAELTDGEHRLLRYLQRQEAKICTYIDIARHLWETPATRITARSLASQNGYSAPMVGQIHVMISNLRRKLEIDVARPQHIATVKGVGYVFYAQPPSTDDGVNYEARRTKASGLREMMQTEFGIYEGGFVAQTDAEGRRQVILSDDDGDEPTTRTPELGTGEA